jgi:hypothetical protein
VEIAVNPDYPTLYAQIAAFIKAVKSSVLILARNRPEKTAKAVFFINAYSAETD